MTSVNAPTAGPRARMNFLGPVILALLMGAGCVGSGTRAPSPPHVHVMGRISGTTYTSPRGQFSVSFPVSPELGGRVVRDDAESVTFHDDQGRKISFYSRPFNPDSPMMTMLRTDGAEKALGTLMKDIYGSAITPRFHADVRGGTISFIYLRPVGTRTGVAAFVHGERVFLVETDLPPGVQFLSKEDDISKLDDWLENGAVDLTRTVEVK